MRRLPAPACRRRGLCRLPRRPDRLGARRAGPGGAGHPAAAHLAAEQPPPRRRLRAERRGGQCCSASTPRRATASSTCANATSCGPSCSRWSRRCAALLREPARPRGRGERPADARRPGRRRAARRRSPPTVSRRPRRSTAFAGEHRLARLALDDGYGAADPVGAGAGHGHPRRRAGAAAARRLPPGDRGRRGGAGRRGPRGGRRSARSSPTCSPASAPSRWRSTGRVYAAEGARDAVARAQGRGRPRRSARSSSIIATCSAARSTPAELDRFDAVVLDPPRAGAKEQAAPARRAAGAAHRLCHLQPRHLRARRDDAGRRRLSPRLGRSRSASSAGRPMSSWPARSAAEIAPKRPSTRSENYPDNVKEPADSNSARRTISEHRPSNLLQMHPVRMLQPASAAGAARPRDGCKPSGPPGQ